MTCKNCLHYGVCYTQEVFNDIEQQLKDFGCEDFADRSEWVHLPCHIGDTVYITSDGDYGEYKITEMNIDSLGKLKVMVECSIHGYGRIGLCPEMFCGQPFCSARLSVDEFGKTALTFDELVQYLGNHEGKGWHISNLKIYGEPKELCEFKKINRDCWYADLGLAKRDCPDCKDPGCFLKRPPRSYTFVEELH